MTVPSVLPTPPFLQPAPCSDAQWDAAGAAVLQMAEETAGLSVTAFSRQEESLPGTSAAAAACVPAAGRLFHSNSLHWLGSAAAAAAAASCRHAALACTACSSPRPMGKGGGWGGEKCTAPIGGGLWQRGFASLGAGQRFSTAEAACSVCLMLKRGGAVVSHRCGEVWPVLSPPVGIRGREKPLQTAGRAVAPRVLQCSGLAGSVLRDGDHAPKTSSLGAGPSRAPHRGLTLQICCISGDVIYHLE